MTEKKRTPQKGLHLKYEELNALYDQTRDFVRNHMGRLFEVEAIEKEGKKGERLTWCGTYCFEVFPEEPWVISVKDWKTGIFERLSGGKDEIQGKFSLYLPLLPIKVKNQKLNQTEAYQLVNQGLSPLLGAAGFPQGSDVSKYIDNLLEKRGIQAPTPWKRGDKDDFFGGLFKEPTPEEVEYRKKVQAFNSKQEEARSAWEVMSHILIHKIAGKTPSKKGEGLHGVEKAKRGLVKQLWKMIQTDKTLLNVVATMYWREEVTLQTWVKAAIHRDRIVEIAQHNRALLPLLPKLPVEYWSWEKLGSVEKLTESLLEIHNQVQAKGLWQQDSFFSKENMAPQYANWLFHNSVSLNYYWLKNIATPEMMEWNDTWTALGLPLWVRRNLLQDAYSLYIHHSSDPEMDVAMGFGGHSKPPERSSAWLQAWAQAINHVIDHHKHHKTFAQIQKRSNRFMETVILLFNGKDHCGNALSSMSPDLNTVLPSTHPWIPILLKAALNENLEQAPEKEPSMLSKARRL